MAKQQLRRTVSMTPTIHERAKRHCARVGQSVSNFTELALTDKLDLLGEPTVDAVDIPLPTPRATVTEAAAQHFTF